MKNDKQERWLSTILNPVKKPKEKITKEKKEKSKKESLGRNSMKKSSFSSFYKAKNKVEPIEKEDKFPENIGFVDLKKEDEFHTNALKTYAYLKQTYPLTMELERVSQQLKPFLPPSWQKPWIEPVSEAQETPTQKEPTVVEPTVYKPSASFACCATTSFTCSLCNESYNNSDMNAGVLLNEVRNYYKNQQRMKEKKSFNSQPVHILQETYS